jgi:uncharacterized membrane protein
MRRAATVTLGLGLAAAAALPGAAQTGGVRLTTPYPAVVVAAGETATFDLEVSAPGRQRVDLAVTEVPRGWDATLRGGGFVIDGVFTQPGEPPAVQLDVSVPRRAERGVHRVVVTATGETGSDQLELDLRVARGGAGQVTLVADFPRVRGGSETTFTVDLELTNNTPQQASFNLEAVGPKGWQVEARPVGQQQASAATVDAAGSTTVQVEIDPPDDAQAGVYPVLVRATGAGRSAEAQLEVEITGDFAMTLTTPDERLSADVTAGDSVEVQLVVINEGSAPLQDVSLSASPPTDWEATVKPETIDVIPPGETARARVTITPSSDALAGDYIVTLSANGGEVSDEVELRTTVKTSPLFGLLGVALIAAALGGLAWVFRTYGRR